MSRPYLRGKVYYGRIPHPDGGSAVRKLSPNKTDARDMLKAFSLFPVAYGPALRAIHDGRRTAADVFARWPGEMDALLRELDDVDVEPHVARWHQELVAEYGAEADTPYRYHLHVRALLPEGVPCPRSRFTADRIAAWLAALPVATNATRRRYHAAVGMFCRYLRRRKVLDRHTDPMPDVPTPKAGDKRVRYLSRPEWTRLLDCLHPRVRPIGLLATIGAELGAILQVRVRDVDLREHTIHLRGKGEGGGATKTHTRARLLSVPAWARPAVAALCHGQRPDAPLIGEPVPALSWLRLRWAEGLRAAGITDYTIHDGRHSYAVWMLSAGAPAEVVAKQLGHKTTTEVNTRYGRWIANRGDMARWEETADKRDKSVTSPIPDTPSTPVTPTRRAD